MFAIFARTTVVFLLMLAMPAQVFAMTVYDVIQLSKKNYSAQDIIALIQTTHSAFELKADDIARLVELGVSEPVIQVMLKAIPVEPAPDIAPSQHVGNKPGAGAISTRSTIDKPAPRADINSEPLEEPGSGKHHHQLITLSGIRLFVLRHEGDYPTVAARARTVADRLLAASAIDNGRFKPMHVAGKNSVMFSPTGNTQPIMIVSVSPQDANAYQRRSGRRVDPDLLAAYWSDLLTDYWSLMLDDQAPSQLTALHEGEALQELYQEMDTSIENNADRLVSAFRSLPKQEQAHLSQLAISVPRDFDAADEHTKETP